MPSYLFAYDLIKESEIDYEILWKELEDLGAMRTQDSLWLVPSELTAVGLRDHLKTYVHKKDRLWIVEIHSGRFAGHRALEGSEKWLKDHPPRTCGPKPLRTVPSTPVKK
jgi:hypothetical protein